MGINEDNPLGSRLELRIGQSPLDLAKMIKGEVDEELDS